MTSDSATSSLEASVLEFDGATLVAEAPHWAELREVQLRIGPGELVVVLDPTARRATPLAAAAQGLQLPRTGAVRFRGHVWTEHDPRRESQLRGQTGRVFAGWGWVSNLSVLENVLLRASHHGRTSESQLEREADALARSVGLAQIPRGRPAHVPADALQRSQWVRALLGSPRLVLLEYPLSDVGRTGLPALVEAVGHARRDGAAVLWTETDEGIARDASLRPSRRFTIDNQRLIAG